MRQKTIKKALQKTDFSDGAAHSHARSPKCPRLTPPSCGSGGVLLCLEPPAHSQLEPAAGHWQAASNARVPRLPHTLTVELVVPQMQVVNLIFLLGSRASQLRKVLAPRSPALHPRARLPARPPTRPRQPLVRARLGRRLFFPTSTRPLTC